MKLKAITAVIAATLSFSATAEIDAQSGRWHTLVNDNGSLYVTGMNKYGQLGHALATTGTENEISVELPAKVAKIDAAHVRSIILLENGDVCIFGYTLPELPQAVSSISGATDVAVNDKGAYVLVNGEVFFGWSVDGSTWTKIEGLSNVTSISARGSIMLAVDVNQAAYNVDGSSATYIQGLPPVLMAETAQSHSMFIDVNNQLWTMGDGAQGKLGLGDTSAQSTPQMVPNGDNVIDAAGGNGQTVVLKNDGNVWVTGWHNYIGTATYNNSKELVQVSELSDVINVSAGDDGVHAMTQEALYSWGGNLYGKLGLGDNVERHVPEVAFTSTYVPEPVIVPEIADVQPGGSYIITGSAFGDITGTVTMDGFVFNIKSWASSEVHIENPPVTMTGDLYLTTADGALSNSWTVTLEPDAPSDTELPVEETCPVPTETLNRLHDLKEVRYLENLQFAWLPVPEKRATRAEHKAIQKPVVAEIKVLRAELNALREAGCPPKRHKYWRANGMELNRFELNWKKRKVILKAARVEMRKAWKLSKRSYNVSDRNRGHGNDCDRNDEDNTGKSKRK